MLVGLPPNESKQSEDQARQIFIGLQNGNIDRALFTANCNAYFDSQALGDFESSLKPLGVPLNFVRRQKSLRGGMTFRVYDIVFSTTHVELTTYQMPDGKIEQFIVTPGEYATISLEAQQISHLQIDGFAVVHHRRIGGRQNGIVRIALSVGSRVHSARSRLAKFPMYPK